MVYVLSILTTFKDKILFLSCFVIICALVLYLTKELKNGLYNSRKPDCPAYRIPEVNMGHLQERMRTVSGPSSLRFITHRGSPHWCEAQTSGLTSYHNIDLYLYHAIQLILLGQPAITPNLLFSSFLKPTPIIPLEPNPVTGFLNYLLDFLDDISHLTMMKTYCKQPRS